MITFGFQVMTFEEAENWEFNPFDLTKVRNMQSVFKILNIHNLSQFDQGKKYRGDIHNLTYFPLLRIWKLINKAERAILQSDFDQSQWKLTTFTFSESSSDFHLILLIFIGLFNLTLSLPENWF